MPNVDKTPHMESVLLSCRPYNLYPILSKNQIQYKDEPRLFEVDHESDKQHRKLKC